MPPTTSDRFFALAARVESALPDAGFTQEQAAELVGALKAYWERPTEQALETLRATQKRLWRTAGGEGRLIRGHTALSANNALCRAAEEFFANESDPDMVVNYFNKCERQLGVTP